MRCFADGIKQSRDKARVFRVAGVTGKAAPSEVHGRRLRSDGRRGWPMVLGRGAASPLHQLGVRGSAVMSSWYAGYPRERICHRICANLTSRLLAWRRVESLDAHRSFASGLEGAP